MADEVDKLRTINRSQQMMLQYMGQKHLALKQSISDGIPKEDILKGYKHYFGETGVIEEPELKVSEPTISEYQIQYENESKIQEMQVLSAPEFGTHKIQTSSKSEPKVSESQVLKSPEPESSSVQTLERS